MRVAVREGLAVREHRCYGWGERWSCGLAGPHDADAVDGDEELVLTAAVELVGDLGRELEVVDACWEHEGQRLVGEVFGGWHVELPGLLESEVWM